MQLHALYHSSLYYYKTLTYTLGFSEVKKLQNIGEKITNLFENNFKI